jgi:glycosyltransferase involved in cell wall biosynthesis
MTPRVIFVGNFTFPAGTAAAARVRSLAEGLVACGADVHVIPMAASNADTAVVSGDGHVYPTATRRTAKISGFRTVRGDQRYRLRARWLYGALVSIPETMRTVWHLTRGTQRAVVVLYGRFALQLTPIIAIARLNRARCLIDVTEGLPNPPSTLRAASPLYWDAMIATRLLPRWCDGGIAITRGLAAMARELGCPRVVTIPPTSQLRAVTAEEMRQSDGPRLAYVGSLIDRDDPQFLFDTVKALRARCAGVSLAVLGRFAATSRDRWSAYCDAVGIRDIVTLIDSPSDEALCKLLADSDGLLLTRRSSPAEALAFPTRLVELLSTGRPVFVSDVGDIASYVRSGVDALVIPPNPAEAARMIADVLNSPDQGRGMGLCGRTHARWMFDPVRHAHRLIAFAFGCPEAEDTDHVT